MASPALAARIEALLQRHWWRPAPTLLMQALRPMSALASGLAALTRRAPQRAPVPVVVVGNLIVGGAGKTPTVVALVQALQQAGWHPGVISRGHGRRGEAARAVAPDSAATEVGDEPLLIRRRTGVPVWVGRRRVAAARALCAAHAEVDVLVSDDGLQHHALARDVEIVVFDERGVGNGLRLPAGPLREALPLSAWPAGRLVLYNAPRPSTPLPGMLVERRLGAALPLADWHAGRAAAAVPLEQLRGRRLVAAAGIAAPERFFSMLEARGLQLQRLPLPDHHAFTTLPWPEGTAEVVVTEKDAVKLAPAALGGTRVWVVGLDFALPLPFIQDVLRRLGAPRST
jgi:tetraacyldisaccharide 4'-kinase